MHVAEESSARAGREGTQISTAAIHTMFARKTTVGEVDVLSFVRKSQKKCPKARGSLSFSL